MYHASEVLRGLYRLDFKDHEIVLQMEIYYTFRKFMYQGTKWSSDVQKWVPDTWSSCRCS